MEWGNFISAPYCGKVLAEMGAEVIKVETPSIGDDSRRHGPFPNDVPDPERSGLFLLANINKRGITLDVNADSGRDVLGRLLASADIFLENQPPARTVELGLDYPALEHRYPNLIVTAITPYGRSAALLIVWRVLSSVPARSPRRTIGAFNGSLRRHSAILRAPTVLRY